MAYQTGNASSITDLLNKLAIFAESNHWIIDKIDASAGTLFLHNSNGFWSFGQSILNNNSVLLIAINSSFNSNLKWNKQQNSSVSNGTQSYTSNYLGAGTNFRRIPFSSYTFMGTEQYLHVIVRVDSRQFRHFGIGTVNKNGIYKGGQYAYGVYSDNDISTSMLAFSSTQTFMGYGGQNLSVIRHEDKDYFCGYNKVGVSAIGCGDSTINRSSRRHPDNLLIQASFSLFNNTITLIPMSLYIYLSSGQYQRIGVVPDFYVARIDSITPGTIQEINGERFYCAAATTYQTTQSNVTNEDNSYDLGYFYRVIE